MLHSWQLCIEKLESAYKPGDLAICKAVYSPIACQREVLRDLLEEHRQERRELYRAHRRTKKAIVRALDASFRAEAAVRGGTATRASVMIQAAAVVDHSALQSQIRAELRTSYATIDRLKKALASWQDVIERVRCLQTEAGQFVRVYESVMYHRHRPGHSGFLEVTENGGTVCFVYGGQDPDEDYQTGRATFTDSGKLLHWCEPFSHCYCKLLQ